MWETEGYLRREHYGKSGECVDDRAGLLAWRGGDESGADVVRLFCSVGACYAIWGKDVGGTPPWFVGDIGAFLLSVPYLIILTLRLLGLVGAGGLDREELIIIHSDSSTLWMWYFFRSCMVQVSYLQAIAMSRVRHLGRLFKYAYPCKVCSLTATACMWVIARFQLYGLRLVCCSNCWSASVGGTCVLP